MTCAESVDVHAMKVMRRTAAAPPLPAMVMAAYGRTRPLLTSEEVILCTGGSTPVFDLAVEVDLHEEMSGS